jgi:hypothetical protein
MHHVHVTAGETEMVDDAFVPKLDQFLDAAARTVESLVEGVLRVVEVDQREVVEAESFRAFLDGAAYAASGVVAVLPVDLGRNPVAGRETPTRRMPSPMRLSLSPSEYPFDVSMMRIGLRRISVTRVIACSAGRS